MNITTLSRKQTIAIENILLGSSIEQAASIAQVSESTVDKWLRIPEFKKVIDDGKLAALTVASAKLATSAHLAVCVLESIMLNEEAPIRERRNAASDLINHALKVYDVVDLSNRIAKIEESLNNG